LAPNASLGLFCRWEWPSGREKLPFRVLGGSAELLLRAASSRRRQEHQQAATGGSACGWRQATGGRSGRGEQRAATAGRARVVRNRQLRAACGCSLAVCYSALGSTAPCLQALPCCSPVPDDHA